MTGYIILAGVALAALIAGAVVFGLEARDRRRRH